MPTTENNNGQGLVLSTYPVPALCCMGLISCTAPHSPREVA